MSKINQDLLVLEDRPMLLIMNREFYYLFVEVSKKEAQRLRYFDIDIEPVICFILITTDHIATFWLCFWFQELAKPTLLELKKPKHSASQTRIKSLKLNV